MASAGEPGPGVDAQGRAVIDPTENVKDVLEAAVRRMDDLLNAAIKRVDDLRQMESDHQKDLSELTRYYGDQLRIAEAKRIDAIRSVDISAVQQASEVASIQATTLANSVTSIAETLRAQVQVTAAASQAALDAVVTPMKSAIEDLRRAQYEAQGQKSQVVEARSSSAALVALAGVGLALVALLVTIVGLMLAGG